MTEEISTFNFVQEDHNSNTLLSANDEEEEASATVVEPQPILA